MIYKIEQRTNDSYDAEGRLEYEIETNRDTMEDMTGEINAHAIKIDQSESILAIKNSEIQRMDGIVSDLNDLLHNRVAMHRD